MINQLYSSIYLGDSSVQRIYQGDDLIYLNGTPDILLEYIANGPDTDNSKKSVFFNTGVVPDVSTKVEICCAAAIIDKGVNVPIISAADADWKGLVICTPMNTGTITSRLGGSYVDGPSIVSNTKYIVTTYQSTSTQGDMIVNGTAYSHSTTNVYGLVPAYLFAYNVNGTVNTSASWSGMKIYYLKFWENNNLIRFYIPVLHYTNGQYTPCFYDKVNDIYIYNLGTDSPTYKIQGDYLLNYIQCGNDYLDQTTGTRCYIRYNPQLPVDLGYEFHMKVNPGNAYYNSPAALQESFIIGERVTGTAKIGFYMPNGNYGIRTGWLNAVYTLWSGNPAGNDFRISWTINQSDRKRSAWVNDSSVQNAGTEVSSVPEELVGANIYINKCGAANVWAGNKYYYIIIDKFTINQRTYVPVLHNGQAMFLDLSNSTYMQHTVDSGGGTDNTLLYSF